MKVLHLLLIIEIKFYKDHGKIVTTKWFTFSVSVVQRSAIVAMDNVVVMAAVFDVTI